MKYVATVIDQTYTIEIAADGRLLVDGEERHVDFLALDNQALYSLLIDNTSVEGLVREFEGKYEVLMWGVLYNVKVMDEREQRLSTASTGFLPQGGEVIIRAPMPGLIIDVPVVVGQEVEAGQTLMILESMKMENELKAPRAGTVHMLNVKSGDSVEQNKSLGSII